MITFTLASVGFALALFVALVVFSIVGVIVQAVIQVIVELVLLPFKLLTSMPVFLIGTIVGAIAAITIL